MQRRVRIPITAPLDSGRLQPATITIDRQAGLFSVRPYRRRRTYTFPLAALAAIVVNRVVKAELAERAKLRQRRRRVRR